MMINRRKRGVLNGITADNHQHHAAKEKKYFFDALRYVIG